MTESRSSPTEGNIITPANSNDSSNKHHYEMAEEHETTAVFVFTAKEGKAVKRKIDFILLPMLCACYIFSVSSFRRLLSPSRWFLFQVPRQDPFELRFDLWHQGSIGSGGLWLQLAWKVEHHRCSMILVANALSIFYIGYMIGSMVWAKLVQRWPGHAGKFIAGAVCAWSIIVLLTGMLSSTIYLHRLTLVTV